MTFSHHLGMDALALAWASAILRRWMGSPFGHESESHVPAGCFASTHTHILPENGHLQKARGGARWSPDTLIDLPIGRE
jgi:hypothetical protein